MCIQKENAHHLQRGLYHESQGKVLGKEGRSKKIQPSTDDLKLTHSYNEEP